MNQFFPEMNKKLAFGLMRLPMKGDQVDLEEVKRMADHFIANGFNYFDTAHGYINGLSEPAFRECVAKRYPREKFLITDKLSGSYFRKQEDIRPFFQSQLKACGVEYFDFYLMHAQNRNNFETYKACRAYETAFELKAEGKIRHVGLSFHDTADVLDRILTEYPELEVVQIQFNYLDYDDARVQSRQCLEVCERHNKPVLVMEPVKGGSLVKLPKEAESVYKELGSLSPASYAIRYVASFERIVMVLSGMSSLEQMQDNVSYMKDFEPLSIKERAAVTKVRDILTGMKLIPCTSCRYCVEENHCPKGILIPDIFSCMNGKKRSADFDGRSYEKLCSPEHGKASDCIRCGKCERVCPQHLPIRELLSEAAGIFEG